MSVALPEILREISGLTVLPDGKLAAVQDELGTLFILNAESGAIEQRIPFGDAGDYEGVESVGDRLYVLTSGGSVLVLVNWASGTPRVRTIETDLESKNDTEGFAYDSRTGCLLIACKEDPGEGHGKKEKTIYALDLESETLSSRPILVIDAKKVEEQLQGNGKFKPSGMAVHPASGDYYVLSSVAKVIVILDRNGQIKDVLDLSDAGFEQPEGLVFTPSGDLLLTSEGKEGPGMLYRFTATAKP